MDAKMKTILIKHPSIKTHHAVLTTMFDPSGQRSNRNPTCFT